MKPFATFHSSFKKLIFAYSRPWKIWLVSIFLLIFAELTAKAGDCDEGQLFDEAKGECLLQVPHCGPREYLDQLSLTCVSKPLTANDCTEQKLRFDPDKRRCMPLSFQDYCEDAEQPYDFIRTVSCILNQIEAYHCRDAEDYLKSHKKLELNDRRFRIGSLNPLLYLDFLEELSLENQILTDIEVLAQLTKLKRLSLANNAISDLSPLAALSELNYLDITGNPIEDFSMIAQLPKLKTLVIDASRIKDLSKIEGLNLELRSEVSTPEFKSAFE